MKEQILQAVQRALQGSRKLKLTFKREAAFAVNYLLEMNQNGLVSLNDGDKVILMDVAQFGDWEKDLNRVITITLIDKFDENWFVDRMSQSLKKIEVIN